MGYQGVLARLFVSVSCKKYSKQLDWIRTRRLKWSSSSIPLEIFLSPLNSDLSEAPGWSRDPLSNQQI